MRTISCDINIFDILLQTKIMYKFADMR